MKNGSLFVLTLIAVGCAEPEPDHPIPLNQNRLIAQGGELSAVWFNREMMEPYSVPVFLFSPNSVSIITMRATLKDGRYDRLHERWNENSEFLMRGVFRDGERCNDWTVVQDGRVVTKPQAAS